jgi:kumamolisin
LLIRKFAKLYKLNVTKVNLLTSSVTLAGTIDDMQNAFKVKLRIYLKNKRTFLARKGSVFVPKAIAPIVTGVFGLDARPLLTPAASRTSSSSEGISAAKLAKLYEFPNATGKNQCVGILCVCGTCQDADINNYFNNSPPSYISVPTALPEGTPAVSTNNKEITIDLEIAGTIAPDAKFVSYIGIEDSEKGILDVFSTAIGDNRNNPSIISMSFGYAENQGQPLSARLNDLMKIACVLGITVIASSGDAGASGNEVLVSPDSTLAYTEVPASSTYVLACGGTKVYYLGNRLIKEEVWRDGDSSSGGGISSIWPVPAYQANTVLPPSVNNPPKPGRGVPDIAACADSYDIVACGDFSVSGTSAAAPLIAGLFARILELAPPRPLSNGQVSGYGSVNHFFYGNKICYPTKSGNNESPDTNGYYSALGTGWNGCTGLGSPNGKKLLKIIKNWVETH